MSKLKELHEAATRGLWKVFADRRTGTVEVQSSGKTAIAGWTGFDDCNRDVSEHIANADLIAYLRNKAADFIALIDAAEQYLCETAGLVKVEDRYVYMDKSAENLDKAIAPFRSGK